MTRLEGLLVAGAVLGISLVSVVRAHSHSYNEQVCSDLPWACLQQQEVVRETVRHPVVRHPLHGSTRIVAPSRHDLVPQLAAKVAEIVSTCGSKLISGFRPHAVVAGTHRASLHSYYPSRAADLAGAPSCIYAHLRGWAGGYSVDYGRVRHVHVSLDLIGHREVGARFVHGGGHRYARHHHRRAA